MLKKEHIACRISGGKIKPKLLDPTNSGLLETAERLIALYTHAASSAMRRGELDAASGALIRAEKDFKTASGLNKLLLDRVEFATPVELDYPALRQEIFLKSAEKLRSGTIHPAEPEVEKVYRSKEEIK